ncbi:flavonol 4'-sulfotransferase-like [Apium graveolens]|uniref:flavonol 4'-sulfotransferase-like n=1 Tax=Apium graveolens TaxID=4045 RepID=UPI003D798C20
MITLLRGVGVADMSTIGRRACGRLGCDEVLSNMDRRNVLDTGYLDGGDVATCPALSKVKAECFLDFSYWALSLCYWACSSDENTDCNYNAKILLLPSRTIAIKVANTNFAQAYEYQGFWFRKETLRGLMWAQDHFIPQPAATLVASYPKTGSTWLKALTFSITTRNRYDLSSNPLQTSISHQCIPFLEYEIPRNPLHKDPTDTFVSWWHFIRKLPPKDAEFVPIEEGFQQFTEGLSVYGPYWEHILGYWRVSVDRPGQVLFLRYEDLILNTSFNVKKLAEFIGYPFSIEEERDGVVERI